MKRLELGCGKNPNREVCNVFHDMIKHSEFVTYTCDLNTLPWNLPHEEFDLVYSNQVMEHMKVDVKDWMDELWKILKVGGKAIIRVPHFTNPNFFIDPTHRRWFSEGTLDYFDKSTLRGDLYGKIYWPTSQFWWRKLKEYRIEGDVVFEMEKLPLENPEKPSISGNGEIPPSQSSMNARFYVISYKNPDRAARMNARFSKVGIPLTFVNACGPDDPRIPKDLDPGSARIWAITWSHLSMIRAFAEVADEGIKYGIFCEDDILIRRDLPKLLPIVTSAFDAYNLDVLLLGYLQGHLPCEIKFNDGFSPPEGAPQVAFLNFHDEVWGTQMYMMSKAHARDTLNYFTEDYAKRSRSSGSGCAPFAADWTLTKRGRRALVYPMMAVEEGFLDSDVPGHTDFHQACRALNYDPAIHE